MDRSKTYSAHHPKYTGQDLKNRLISFWQPRVLRRNWMDQKQICIWIPSCIQQIDTKSCWKVVSWLSRCFQSWNNSCLALPISKTFCLGNEEDARCRRLRQAGKTGARWQKMLANAAVVAGWTWAIFHVISCKKAHVGGQEWFLVLGVKLMSRIRKQVGGLWQRALSSPKGRDDNVWTIFVIGSYGQPSADRQRDEKIEGSLRKSISHYCSHHKGSGKECRLP